MTKMLGDLAKLLGGRIGRYVAAAVVAVALDIGDTVPLHLIVQGSPELARIRQCFKKRPGRFQYNF